jgi:broad specificity phosphatase PhoE
MPIIYLVRHGRVAANPADPLDPELSPDGAEQAREVARELHARLPSPRVAEIPSPQPTPGARAAWLKQLLASTWAELERAQDPNQAAFSELLAAWRRGVRAAVCSCNVDTVIFTHFVPLNVVVGSALGQDRVVCFRPDNASLTIVETPATGIRLIELGREMAVAADRGRPHL